MLIGEPQGDVMEAQLSTPSQLTPAGVRREGRRSGFSSALRPAAGRQADGALLAALRADALILAEPDAPHSVESLARVAGVSARSLCRGFQRLRGCGPMAAVRRVRLQFVRRDLLEAGPDGRVTDIAMRWGFYHLGRFSRLYAAQFGELPSATHRRSHEGAVRGPNAAAVGRWETGPGALPATTHRTGVIRGAVAATQVNASGQAGDRRQDVYR